MLLIETRYWRYVLYRAHLNLVADASRYYLGWLWWVLEPLAMTAVVYVVFNYLRGRDEGFIYFLIVGVTTWLWFSGGVGNATQTLTGARNLILQMRLPKIMFPLVTVIGVTYKQAFVFLILLLVVGGVFGASPAWAALPALMAVQLLLIVAGAVTVAFLCVWLPDLRFVVASLLQLMMFCSGIFFEIESFPVSMQEWFRLNPMAVMLEQYRLILLHETLPDFLWCAWMAAVCGAWIFLMDFAYRRWDQQLTRRIIA